MKIFSVTYNSTGCNLHIQLFYIKQADNSTEILMMHCFMYIYKTRYKVKVKNGQSYQKFSTHIFNGF